MILNFDKTSMKKIEDITLFTGVIGMKIIGINLTRAELSKHLDWVDSEGEEFEYSGITEFKAGKFLSDSGELIEATEEKQFNVPFTSISLLMESISAHKYTVKVNGKDEEKTSTIKKSITFRFYNTIFFNKDVNKYECFNNLGQTKWASSLEQASKDLDKGVTPCRYAYRSMSTLGFDQFINFIYAYTHRAPGKIDLLSYLNFDEFFKGNFSSLREYIEAVHTQLGIFGVKVLFMVENNESTNNMDRQSFFPRFQQLYDDDSKIVSENIREISSAVDREAKPSQTGERKYTPGGRGWFISTDGSAKFGLKQFKPSYMKDMKSEFERKFGQSGMKGMPGMPMPTVSNLAPPTMGGGFGAGFNPPDGFNPFGQ